MGNQKQKWTPEEEDALNRGVLKHGAGKWKNILKDPEFAASLVNRSNIDLKDKWRNLNVAPGQTSKEKSRTPKGKTIFPVPAIPSPSGTMNSTTVPSPAAPVATVQYVIPSQSQNDDEANIPPRYDPMIIEALSTIKDPNGLDINAIVSFIEQKHKVPQIQNFRRALGTKLRRLVSQGKLEKVQNCYKLKDTPTVPKLPDQKSPTPEAKVQPEAEVQPEAASPAGTSSKVQPEAEDQPEPEPEPEPESASSDETSLTFEEAMLEAAMMTAPLIADAEAKTAFTDKTVKEMEMIDKMVEHNEAMLQFAEELFKKCSEGAVFNFDNVG